MFLIFFRSTTFTDGQQAEHESSPKKLFNSPKESHVIQNGNTRVS
jgi:hypothetical protein